MSKSKNQVPQEFIDGIAAKTTDQLKELIVQLQIQNEENETFKESEAYIDEVARYDLAKERFNETAGPVKNLTKLIKAKTKLVLERLKEKGGM